MTPLRDHQRRRLLTLSAVCCAIPLCLTPLAARSSFELGTERGASAAPVRLPIIPALRAHTITVLRDPFVQDAHGAPSPVLADPLQQPGSIPPGFFLPPNRGAAVNSVMLPFANPAVRAIVTGAGARALVEDQGRPRIVGIGDMLGNSRVAGIDKRGIHLQNGLVLRLTEEDQ